MFGAGFYNWKNEAGEIMCGGEENENGLRTAGDIVITITMTMPIIMPVCSVAVTAAIGAIARTNAVAAGCMPWCQYGAILRLPHSPSCYNASIASCSRCHLTSPSHKPSCGFS